MTITSTRTESATPPLLSPSAPPEDEEIYVVSSVDARPLYQNKPISAWAVTSSSAINAPPPNATPLATATNKSRPFSSNSWSNQTTVVQEAIALPAYADETQPYAVTSASPGTSYPGIASNVVPVASNHPSNPTTSVSTTTTSSCTRRRRRGRRSDQWSPSGNQQGTTSTAAAATATRIVHPKVARFRRRRKRRTVAAGVVGGVTGGILFGPLGIVIGALGGAGCAKAVGKHRQRKLERRIERQEQMQWQHQRQ